MELAALTEDPLLGPSRGGVSAAASSYVRPGSVSASGGQELDWFSWLNSQWQGHASSASPSPSVSALSHLPVPRSRSTTPGGQWGHNSGGFPTLSQWQLHQASTARSNGPFELGLFRDTGPSHSLPSRRAHSRQSAGSRGESSSGRPSAASLRRQQHRGGGTGGRRRRTLSPLRGTQRAQAGSEAASKAKDNTRVQRARHETHATMSTVSAARQRRVQTIGVPTGAGNALDAGYLLHMQKQAEAAVLIAKAEGLLKSYVEAEVVEVAVRSAVGKAEAGASGGSSPQRQHSVVGEACSILETALEVRPPVHPPTHSLSCHPPLPFPHPCVWVGVQMCPSGATGTRARAGLGRAKQCAQ
eukprot:COSAG01_NODE_15879_length_1289_cov_1.350420_1_plen_357_part_00